MAEDIFSGALRILRELALIRLVGFFNWHPPTQLGSPGCCSSPIVVVSILTFMRTASVITQFPTKSEIRKNTLALRDAMPESERVFASNKLVEYVGALGLNAGEIVSSFLPIRSEIDLRPIMEPLTALGVRLCLPVVLDKQTIGFREYLAGIQLVDTGFGTSGPGEDARILDPDVMLMPLAAFDDEGNRIGYGAGHYDRAIARLHATGNFPRLIGVAFDCQRVQSVPAEAHDVSIHTVLTETGLYRFGQKY